MTTYTLPTITTSLGTFTVVLEAATAGLTQPTENTVVKFGTVSESLDLTPGRINLSTFTFNVIDDYTVHANGFWYEVLSADCNIKITLDEGSGATLVFYGKAQSEETVFEELYVNGTTYDRTARITLKSLLTELENVSIADLLTECDDHLTTESLTLYQHLNFGDLMASALAVAFSQAFSSADIYQQSTSDFVYNNGSGSEVLLSLSWRYKYNSASPPTENWQRVYYTDSTSAVYFGARYGNAWELIQGICENFGVVPRHVYDIANSRHKIQLLQRGTNYAVSTSLQTPQKSSVLPGSPQVMGDLRVTRFTDGSHSWWSHRGAVYSGTPPDFYRPDTTIEMLFVFNAIGVSEYEKICGFTSATTEAYITAVQVWEYTDSGLVNYPSASYDYAFQRAMYGYMMGRYYGAGQITYHREYPLYKVDGGDHTDMELMKQVTIGVDVFQVVSCEKDFNTGVLKATLTKI